MRNETYLRRRLHTLQALHDAVSAMRSLSAHHLRLLRQALPAARDYRTEIDHVVGAIGLHQPSNGVAPGGGLVVVASDLGLCGDYNAQLAQQTLRAHAQHQLGPVYTVGRRLRPTLARAGIMVQRHYDAPASLDGLSRLLLQLAQDLLEDYTALSLHSLYLVAARFNGVGDCTPMCTRLLPIAPLKVTTPVRCSPYVAPGHLTAVAVREFLYIAMYETLLDALASEHGMRLTATEAALQWIDTTVEHTTRALRARRSETATQEVLDIVAGARARRHS